MKHLLVENELEKLRAFDSSHLRDKRHFEKDCSQNYLAFQSMCKYSQAIDFINHISAWKFTGLSHEFINSSSAANNIINPLLSYAVTKARVKFDGSCLKQEKITYTYGKIENIFIFCDINKNYPTSSYPVLENCLFGAVKLTKNSNISKYKYSRYGTGFNRKGKFSVGDELGWNCIIFGVDMSFSVHVDNKEKD